MFDWFHQLMDAGAWLQYFGPWVLGGVAIIVFIESGVLFPFLPGDSLLVTAGALHPELHIEIWQLILVAATAAVCGDQVGYWIGRKFGRGLFKEDARILKTKYLNSAEDFFHRRGPLALVLGRYVPIVRTYVPVSAGTAAMPYRRFLTFSVIGATTWVISMSLIGAALSNIPGIGQSVDRIILLVVAISLLPIAFSALMKYIKSNHKAS